MDLTFSDEQQFLREAVRGTVEREAPLPTVRTWVLDPEEPDHGPAWAIGLRQGWTGIGISEELGGQGGDLLELVILAQELGRCAVPADALYATLLATTALARAERSPAITELIATLAEGEQRAALLHPGGRACDVPLRGAAADLVLGAGGADTLIAFTGEALALYPRDAVACTPRRHVDRTRSLADVRLTGEPSAIVPLADPTTAMRDVAARAAAIVAADALGAADRMLAMTTDYVADRVQFGVPVGSFQAVKHTAAEMLVAIEGTRAAVEYAAWAVGAGEDSAATDAWVAKARAARTGSFVADKALFLHGAVGYTWEHDLQLLFKRAKSDAELFGGAGAYDDRIADSLALSAGAG